MDKQLFNLQYENVNLKLHNLQLQGQVLQLQGYILNKEKEALEAQMPEVRPEDIQVEGVS